MADTPFPRPPANQVPVLSRLQHEWRRITIRTRELHAVRRWGLPGTRVETLDDILDRCGFAADACDGSPGRADNSSDDNSSDDNGSDDNSADRPDGPLSGDDYLLHLVRLARDDVLAARIVLQRILPPLCAVARRHTINRQQRDDLMDELVANAWTVICNFPTDRGRRRIAASIVRDVTFETLVRPSRRRCANEVPTERDQLGDPADQLATEPLDELVELLRDAHTAPGVGAGDIDFICQLISHGKPESLAVALDVTPRTVRNHRDVVVHRLRTMVAQAA